MTASIRKSRDFGGLNYSFGNEDNSVEQALLPHNVSSVATVCHSGAQLIGFLAKEPRAINVIDISEEQLIVAQLRMHLLRTLSHADYLRFWGYAPYDREQPISFRKAALRGFEHEERAANWFNTTNHPLYVGKWEQTCRRLSRLYRFLLGADALHLFSCRTREEQDEFLRVRFPKHRWRVVVNAACVLASSYTFMRPDQLPPGASPRDLFPEYKRIFSSLLKHNLAADNFFLQMILLGRMSTALPLEAQHAIYEKAQHAVSRCKVAFVKSDVFTHLQSSTPYDFVTLSNVPSYLECNRKRSYLQEIKTGIAPGGQVVARNFLNPHRPSTEGYDDKSEQVRDILNAECTQVYEIALYQRLDV